MSELFWQDIEFKKKYANDHLMPFNFFLIDDKLHRKIYTGNISKYIDQSNN